MGVETALIIGSTLLKAGSQMSAAQDAADAEVGRANLEAENKAKQTRYRAASQQLSFLNSGLTLEGTPMSAIQSTFRVGLEDIDLIRSNATKKAKNFLSEGRSQAIGSIASGFSGLEFGSSGESGGRTFGSPNQSWDFTDNFSSGVRADKAYAAKGGFGPYRY
jgi:hypothetical protein